MMNCSQCGMDLSSATETEQDARLCRYCRDESTAQDAPQQTGQGFVLVAVGTCEACGEWTRTFFDGVRTGGKVGTHGYLCRECWAEAYGAEDFRQHWPNEPGNRSDSS